MIQPNRWSCLITAFAIATEIDVSRLIEEIGHDGSEIIFPKNPEPYCRRGFTPSEISKALLKLGFACTEISCRTEIISKGETLILDMDMQWVLDNFNCVVGGEIHGNRHAAFWNHNAKLFLDPNGTIHSNPFDIESVWVVSHLRTVEN